ncbi:hypothetical protein PO878_13905 [Iamia majanohamensis]|uniref:Uncharacterized protein n=1 Tax=Iamia majanohamensis TaxID=467976 RepID=A0AAE9Y787_9ACTN|nr:hypothetical protein [Iamia majanohamensis]WCO65594.1 hypothetical protein PO878_13905 [Iamia majanohamensis]
MDVDRPGGGDDLVTELTRFLAEQRADAAAAARARERWLRQAADEEALVAGVLLDLAERADTVVVQGVAGRTHRGRVRGVGEDFVALRTGRSDVLLPFDAVLAIRPEGRPLAGAARAQALDLALAEALSAVAGERPRILVVARDGSGLSGELRAVGRDVLTLRLADADGTVYVPIASLAEVTVTEER